MLDLLAELADVMSEVFPHDLWLLSVGIDNNPWGQYQSLIPDCTICVLILGGGRYLVLHHKS